MLQIDNHEEKALSVIIPYLLQFPELYGLTQNSGTRAQYLEDVAWELLWNLDIDSANGVWLDYLGKKVGQSRTYSPTVEGAFTFGGTADEGFGEGKFLSSALTGPSTKIARSDANFKNAIRAKIIENNTDCSLDELINACKLLYNASIVRINENYPADISSIYMYGNSLLESSNANAEIKKMIPAGVSLDAVYFQNIYNIFANNAYVTYSNLIPSYDNFELSFYFTPTTVDANNTILLSQGETNDEYSSVSISYNNTDGIIFNVNSQIYSNGSTVYENGSDIYSISEIDNSFSMSGGTVIQGSTNSVKITREVTSLYVDGDLEQYIDGFGNSYDDNGTYKYTLYVNDIEVDVFYSETGTNNTDVSKLFLGAGLGNFYNRGSIFNLHLENNNTSTVLINDTLKSGTTGNNYGVIFL